MREGSKNESVEFRSLDFVSVSVIKIINSCDVGKDLTQFWSHVH